jgi:paraquat-inducible protein B
MTEPGPLPGLPLERLPEARVEPPGRHLQWSVIWLLPLLAVLIGAWMVYRDYAGRGPVITIRFRNAEGIEPNKTRVKYRDVDVGLVEEVQFSRDLTQVVVRARLEPAFRHRISDAARFWVVRPRIEGLRISGLETLISGAYISMDLGREAGRDQYEFDGLEEPRSILSDTPGSFFALRTSGLGSLAVGSPVYFRGIAVGEVVKYRLSRDQGAVEIDIFVREPHDRQVRENTRFWNVSGIDVRLGADGLQVNVQSLASLVQGGVAFETPQTLTAGRRADPATVFTLYQSLNESQEAPITVVQHYLLHFDDTVRGLSVGAPVEFRGLRVGTVTDIAFEGNARSGPVRTPVTIAIEPERVPLADPGEDGSFGQPSGTDQQARVRMLMVRAVKAGMRARLDTGNLLTGQLFVSLDFVPGAEPAEVRADGRYPELPTVPGTFTGITRSLTRLLGKLESLPLEQIGRHLAGTLAGSDRLMNSAALHTGVENLSQALRSLDRVLELARTRGEPLLLSVQGAAERFQVLVTDTRAAVRRAEAALGTIEHTVSEQGPVGRELVHALAELAAAARSVRIMAEYLERHPEALLQGKAGRP